MKPRFEASATKPRLAAGRPALDPASGSSALDRRSAAGPTAPVVFGAHSGRRASGLVWASLLLTFLLLATLLSPRLGAPEPVRAQSTAGCQLRIDRQVAPARPILEGKLGVTMTVAADCAAMQAPLHLVLLVDNSTDMGGPRMEGLRQGVAALADGLDFTRSKAALLSFNSRVDLLSPLTDDKAAFVAASQRFFPRQGNKMDVGLRAATQLLQQARPAAVEDRPMEVLILVAGGLNEDGPEAALAEAQIAKDDGILLVTVAAGGAADYDMLESMASSSALFYIETIAGRYPSLFREIIDDVVTVKLTGALIEDQLPPALAYSWGSGVPAPRVRGDVLSWRYAIWPAEGITVTYLSVCNSLGPQPSSLAAWVELSFDRGKPLRMDFPLQDIECIPAPSATATPTGTLPPSATPTLTPQPTATPLLRPIYLPVAWRHFCPPTYRQVDVVLVLDASSSMHQLAASGELKLQLALDAASVFVDALSLPTDRAAVVAFSGQADLLQPLSGNRIGLQLALTRIFEVVRQGSRLDLGLDAARELLAAPSRPAGRLPVVILLTDGLADGPRALAAADRLRVDGVTVYAVGLGDTIDANLLSALAGSPDRFFQSPDGDELAQIYLDIARSAGCPTP